MLILTAAATLVPGCHGEPIPTDEDRVASLLTLPFAAGTAQSVQPCELDLAIFTIGGDFTCLSDRCIEQPSTINVALDSALPPGSMVIRSLGAEYTSQGIVLDDPVRVDSCPNEAPLVQVIAGRFDGALLRKLPDASEYCSQASVADICFQDSLINARIRELL
jgi:hypothetical protein